MTSLVPQLTALLLLCLILLAPARGHAEWMADLYIGGGHVKADDNDFVVGGTVVRPLVSSDWASPIGGRIGYWLDRAPWLGVAFDASFFFPAFADDGPSQPTEKVTVTVLPLSALIMLRLPLQTARGYPMGRIQPYAAAGPSLVFGSLSEFAGVAVTPPAVLEDRSFSVGFDIRAGVTVMFSERVGAFVEYRYLRTQPSFHSATGSGRVTYEPTLRVNAGVLGVSFRF